MLLNENDYERQGRMTSSSKGCGMWIPRATMYTREHAVICEIIRCDPHSYIRPCESGTRTQNTRPYPTLRRRCTLESGGCSFLAAGSSTESEGSEKEEENAEKQSRLSWSSGGRIAQGGCGKYKRRRKVYA